MNPIFANKDSRKSTTVNIFTSLALYSWPWGLNLPFDGHRLFALLSQVKKST